MLLTPAEILGAATPEKMMGITERDAFGQPRNLTAMERYTERQNQMQLSLAKTNALQAGDSSSAWNYSSDSFGVSNSFRGEWRNPEAMASPLFQFHPGPADTGPAKRKQRLVKIVQPTGNDAGPQPVAARGQGHGAVPTVAQSGFIVRHPHGNVFSGRLKDLPAENAAGFQSGPALPKPVGASFTPLSSGISKPPDLPKLPTAWSLSYTSTPPAAAWAPQQAPWLTPGPQPFVAPQRKF